MPADPTPEQVDAWVELAELVGDADFRVRVREMAVAGARAGEHEQAYDPGPALEHAGAAVTAGVDPESAQARTILERISDPHLPAEERARLAERLATFTDRRVERYWQLLGVLNDWPVPQPQVPAFEWVIAALRAHR